jgi:hypothetical protein
MVGEAFPVLKMSGVVVTGIRCTWMLVSRNQFFVFCQQEAVEDSCFYQWLISLSIPVRTARQKSIPRSAILFLVVAITSAAEYS